jgi:hypothetical protein
MNIKMDVINIQKKITNMKTNMVLDFEPNVDMEMVIFVFE